MKNVKQDYDDDLRPEYTRSDFANSVRGKYANAEFEFSGFARALIYCVAELEGLKFTPHSQSSNRDHRPREWTYEIDKANRITLRYWLSESSSIEEPIPGTNRPSITPRESRELQNMLTLHIRALKAKVAAQ
jgi:hypothetical protein